MSRKSLNALEDLNALSLDAFFFLSDNADDRAIEARDSGLDEALDRASDEAAFGLEAAQVAPEGAPPEPGLQIDQLGLDLEFRGAGAISSGGAAGLSLDFGPSLLSGRDDFDPMFQKPDGLPGNGGGGDDGGSDGGTSEPALFWTYASGATDTATVDFYNIEIDFYGDSTLWDATGDKTSGYTGGFLDAFIGAADYLTTVISGGLHFDSWEGRDVDDIVIRAYLTPIDGSGGILGQAGPETARDFDLDGVIDGLTVTGIMEFDSADADILLNGGSFGAGSSVEGGLWNDTVLHEMLHVLGFGTLWGVANEDIGDFSVGGYNYTGVPSWNLVSGTAELDSDGGTKRPHDDQHHYDYRGGASAYYDDSYNSGVLSVEANGGSGTAGGHWDEFVHGNELMTGYINTTRDADGNYNHIEDFTVAALADLGYHLTSSDYASMAVSGTAFLAEDDFGIG